MNISNLQPPAPPQFNWRTVPAQDRECEFLSLRLLNKRLRARLSPQPLDLSVFDGKGNFLVIANTKGWFAAIARGADGNHQIIFSLLSDLKQTITTSTEEGELNYTPKRVLPVAGPPVHLALSSNDDRLVVGIADGTIAIFDTSSLFREGSDIVDALKVFMPSPPGPVRQILGNPGDLPDLVAIRRDSEGANSNEGASIEIIDTRQLTVVGGWRSGLTADTTPTAITWSSKGKQIAIGLKSGDIVTYSPSDTTSVKFQIPRPPSVGDASVISLHWLYNQVFHCVYTPPGNRSPDVQQKHVLTFFEPKTRTAIASEFQPPYYPSPALRGPGLFSVLLRNWNPIKTLLFISDSTSSDIGTIGSIEESDTRPETWCNISLEETSTPSVPLDKDAEDTVPLALDVDLASTDSSSQPILYVYASDGTVQGWLISNKTTETYPGMITPVNSSVSSAPNLPVEATAAKTEAPAFAQSSYANPAFGSSGFASTPQFGQSSFGGPVSGAQNSQQSTFASSTFGQEGNSSAFSQTSGTSAFGQSGFSAFASSGPSSFGSSASSFNNTVPAVEDKSSSAATAYPEAVMSDVGEDNSGLGGLSLGSADTPSNDQPSKTNSMFGSFGQGPVQNNATGFSASSASGQSSFGAFGNVSNSSLLKPATGFGAFSQYSQPQTPPKPVQSSSNETPKPSSAFGSSGFGSSGFGQPAFGQPSFGQPSFGQTSTFGKPSTFGGAAPSAFSSPSSGGFGAFAGASKGFGAFAQSGNSSFAQHAQSLQVNPSPSITMATSMDDTDKSTSATPIEDKKETPITTAAAENATVSSTTTLPTAFGSSKPTNVFGGSSFLVPNKQSSAFSTPTSASRTETPGSSPEGSPAPGQKPALPSSNPPSPTPTDNNDSASQAASASGTSSVFKAPSGPAVNAFANLVTTPNVFKPAEGFGAFGAAAKVPSTSPFANPKPVTPGAFATPVKPISAFAPGSSKPSSSYIPSGASTTPKFGTPSAPGGASVFGTSTFGVPSTPSPVSTTPLSTPSSNAFSAFSGASGGFSAFAKAAGQTTSFKDMLKSQKDPELETKPTEKEKEEEKNEKGRDKGLKIDSSFVEVQQPDELDPDNLPPTPSTHGTFDSEDQNLGEEEQNVGEEEKPEKNDDDEDSFLSESFSSGSSDDDSENDDNEKGEQDADGEELEEGEIEESDDKGDAVSSTEKLNSGDNKASKIPKPVTSIKAPLMVNIPEEPEIEKSTTPVKSPPPALFGKTGSSSGGGIFGKQPPSYKAGITDSGILPKPVPFSTNLKVPSEDSTDLGRPGSTIDHQIPPSNSKLPKARPASPKLPFGQLPVKQESTTPSTSQDRSQSSTPIAPPSVSASDKLQPGSSSSVFRPPSFTSSAAAGNAPFIMPSSATTGPLPPGGRQPMTFGNAQGPSQAIALQQGQKTIAQQSFESSMQKECMTLYQQMQEDLDMFGKQSQRIAEIRSVYGRSVNLVHSRDELGNSSKWLLGDLEAFTRLTKGVEKDVLAAYAVKDELLPLIREVESNLLKAETRKEEIVRFSKAKADPEFSKMLKSRTLGPDVAETQNQLRRQIQAVSNRVEQLEAHLKECKRKLEDHKKGKASIKPPSLDTINRTYQNIDTAIEAQNKYIEALTMRVARLDIDDIDEALHGTRNSKWKKRQEFSDSTSSTTSNDNEGSKSTKQSHVTPSIAAWTAAALNAERSALRLKNALAKARKEPLLNTQAVTPVEKVPTLESLKPRKPVSPLEDLPPLPSQQSSETASEYSRRVARTITHHAKPVKLGQSSNKPSSTVPSFDWGPLPTTKPLSSLPFNLSSTAEANS